MFDIWKNAAYQAVYESQADPDHRPVYRVPNRSWWQFWKPKWRTVVGVSTNDILRAHGFPTL